MVVRNAVDQVVRELNRKTWSENVESLEAQAVWDGVKLAIERG